MCGKFHMKLPQQLTYEQLMTKWAAILNPIIDNPANDSIILKNIVIVLIYYLMVK